MTLLKRLVENYEEQTSSLEPVDMAYVAVATVMILIITPGIALFYGGMQRACSDTSSSVIMGNFTYGALQNIGAGPLSEGGTIPAILSFTFNAIFAICTVQIFLGAISERGRLLPSLVLAPIWCTLCYCPFAYWTWSAQGWLYNLGSLDFAGGGPVHVSSGVASLAFSLFLGKRKGWVDGKPPKYRPYSPVLSFLGSLMIYFPWLFFNSGTLTTITTPKTLYILTNTHLAASFAMATFVIYDYILRKKWSLSAASEGLIVGLVFVTPTCGQLEPWAIAVGSIFTALVCRSTYHIHAWIGIDDTSHSFNVHGIGGILGSICNGVFASPYIANMDGVTDIKGGWIHHHWKQMGYQLAGDVAIVCWTFFMTYVLCFIIDKIPGLKMRVSEDAEEMGLDLYDMAEVADPFIPKPFNDQNHNDFENSKVEYLTGQNLATSSNSNLSSNNIEMGDIKRPVPNDS